jgi:hypothetical protein
MNGERYPAIHGNEDVRFVGGIGQRSETVSASQAN